MNAGFFPWLSQRLETISADRDVADGRQFRSLAAPGRVFVLGWPDVSQCMSLSPYLLDAIVFYAAYRLQVLA